MDQLSRKQRAYLGLLAGTVLLLTVAGCGGGGENESVENTSESTAQVQNEESATTVSTETAAETQSEETTTQDASEIAVKTRDSQTTLEDVEVSSSFAEYQYIDRDWDECWVRVELDSDDYFCLCYLDPEDNGATPVAAGFVYPEYAADWTICYVDGSTSTLSLAEDGTFWETNWKNADGETQGKDWYAFYCWTYDEELNSLVLHFCSESSSWDYPVTVDVENHVINVTDRYGFTSY